MGGDVTTTPVLVNGKSPEQLAALKKKYEASKIVLEDAKNIKCKYQNVFAEAKAKFSQTDPTNSSLNEAKANFDKYNNSYVDADNQNTSLNLLYFQALT